MISKFCYLSLIFALFLSLSTIFLFFYCFYYREGRFLLIKEGSRVMNKEHHLIKELKNFCYDTQYLKEMKTLIEQEDFGINKIYSSLQQMKILKIETDELDLKLKNVIDKLFQEETNILTALENKQKIHRQINSIEPPFRNVLYFRYICNNTFSEIAFKMNYSTKRIYQLHKKAISIYCEKYK